MHENEYFSPKSYPAIMKQSYPHQLSRKKSTCQRSVYNMTSHNRLTQWSRGFYELSTVFHIIGDFFREPHCQQYTLNVVYLTHSCDHLPREGYVIHYITTLVEPSYISHSDLSSIFSADEASQSNLQVTRGSLIDVKWQITAERPGVSYWSGEWGHIFSQTPSPGNHF